MSAIDMPLLLLIGGFVALIVGATVYATKAQAKAATVNKENTLDDLFRKIGAEYNIDPLLLKAIAMQESALNVNAVRWNPPYDVSVGMMQILCTPPEGQAQGADYLCQNRFNIDPWPVTYNQLKNPELNVRLGAQILAWNLQTFGFPRGIAVYNRWDARLSQPQGPFPNQSYVEKVLSNYERLKGAT